MSRKKLKLLPYKRIDCLSIQDAKQRAGWEITAFDLPRVWEKFAGENVVIGVVDTGADLDHHDLRDNLLDGFNVFKKRASPQDDAEHGSHVTGTLVACNNDIGVVGVCPKAKVKPIKALDKHGNGSIKNVTDGIYWGADNGCDILCMSLGIPMEVPAVHEAIKYAASKNVVTFVAAGNAGDTKEVFYPAAYPETIAIGAVDVEMRRAKFSNTGESLDFMAPGVDIFSTVPPNWYATLSGTSMAAPFAVGCAALVLSYVKSGQASYELKTADDYRRIFKMFTTPVNNGNYTYKKFYEGFGIIDPRKFIETHQ